MAWSLLYDLLWDVWSYHIITGGYLPGIFIRILIFYQFGGHIATYIKGVFSSGKCVFSFHKTLLFVCFVWQILL